MVRYFAAFAVLLALMIPAAPAQAQQWNDERTLELVRRATDRRAVQLADTALQDYRARARGFLTLLAQVGAGFPEPPKIVKADELALDVFWRAPNLSKQLIIGRRDTLLLPTDIQYHRDHLGIVQNNFPEIIRLGDGDEVEDVPHPLSEPGLVVYDFAISDSLQLRLGPRSIDVMEVRVRPRNDRAPRAVGALYIDTENAELVRMALGFTRVALKDPSLEDLSIVLENGLIEGRFWLPRRQEIEIRRTGTWFEYPVRTIIRGRWEICCYAVNVGLDPGLFAGPEIVVAPPQMRPAADAAVPLFEGTVIEALGDEADPVSDEEVRQVQEEVRRLVRAQALERAPRPAVAANRISEFVSFNRVEGFALGAGVGQRIATGLAALLQARHGFADDRWKGRGELSYTRPDGFGARIGWRDWHHSAGDVQEVSLLRNTIAAQEFGSDYTQPFRARGLAVGVTLPTGFGRVVLSAADERHLRLDVNATSAHGRFAPTLAIPSGRVRSAAVRVEHPTRQLAAGFRLRFDAELSAFRAALDTAARVRYGRGSMRLGAERDFDGSQLVFDVFAAALGGGEAAVPQHHVFIGGPISAPGYEYHQFAGRRGGFARTEWRTSIGFPSLPLGRFGRTPGAATLAPFANLAWMSAPASFGRGQSGAYPGIGVGLLPFFDLLRIDVARGLRDGRWTFGLDITRDFWPVL